MSSARKFTPVGYAWLARHFQADPIPHFVESFLAEPGQRRTETERGRVREIYPHTSYRLETVFDHLEFALKREGLHLELLRGILPRIPTAELVAYIQRAPTGANVRRVWYFYERFTRTALPLKDLQIGNYVPLADPQIYYTGPGTRFPRWRINRNLLHTIDFSPMVRRSETLVGWEAADLQERCKNLLGKFPPEIFQRALRFLYAKETRTSYAIENEIPSRQRAEEFMALLARAGQEQFLEKAALIELQNAIVDARFAAMDWRTIQNYVGSSLAPGVEEVHLVPPRPEDLPKLMEHWLALSRRLAAGDFLPPIVAAAVVAWLFVYLHPFEDGNGRIHRFLIHHVLAQRRFGPPGVLLPVSAAILNRPKDYDDSLEGFSKPLKARSDYTLDGQLRMKVLNPTMDHFRYVDCTAMAEALFLFIDETIEKELPAELSYLQSYDRARAGMRDVVDLPEITANLFLRLCFQNGGRLAKGKRKLAAFAMLTDAEIAGLEEAIATAYEGHLPESGTITPQKPLRQSQPTDAPD